MLEAILSSKRSPDPNTQVGACIVNKKNRVLATGYNSLPNCIHTEMISWSREDENPLNTKYPFVVHAEKNAIYNASSSVEDAILFVSLFPCNECAKDIIQAGISKVYYLDNPYPNTWQIQSAKQMFQMLDLPVRQYKWKDKEIVLSCLTEIAEQVSLRI
jgi:dCMP deaminase